MTDAPVRLRPEIADATPYRAGRPASGEAFKLSSNENPFDPLPSVLAALDSEHRLNRYPDATARRLREVLAVRHGVDVEAVHVGAGSVSLLAQFILATAGPGDEVVYAWRSFEAYPGLVRVAGATAVEVPVDARGRHDTVAMAAAVTERTRLVLVCSPNNPTGTAVTQAEFDALVAAVPGDVLILLDEAYAEFVTAPDAVRGLTGAPTPDAGPATDAGAARRPLPANVVVLRTFSKAYGLAGLRVGYAIGHPRVLDAARITAIPFSVTEQAETAAIASLAAEDELAARVADLVARRERLAAGLRGAGWSVPYAQGNFVWLPTGERTAEIAGVFDDAGLIVRPLGEGIRISVGEADSVERVVRVAASVVEHLPERSPTRG